MKSFFIMLIVELAIKILDYVWNKGVFKYETETSKIEKYDPEIRNRLRNSVESIKLQMDSNKDDLRSRRNTSEDT